MIFVRKFCIVVELLLTMLLLSTVSRSAAPMNAPKPDFEDALFIAESKNILKVALADGRILFEIPQTGQLKALAVDERAGTLWVYRHKRLSAYNFSGPKLLTVPLPRSSTTHHAPDDEDDDDHGEAAAHLALLVNPNDHSLWLVRDRELLHLDAGGGLLQAINHRSPIQALAFDHSRNILWVATAATLTAYDDAGHRLRHLTQRDHPDIRTVVYDPSADVIWVAYGAHRLYRYRAENGVLERRITFLQPSRRSPRTITVGSGWPLAVLSCGSITMVPSGSGAHLSPGHGWRSCYGTSPSPRHSSWHL